MSVPPSSGPESTPPPKPGRLRADSVAAEDVASAGRHVPRPSAPRAGGFAGVPLWGRWWFTPLAGVVIFLYLFRSEGGEQLLPGGGASTWFPSGQSSSPAAPFARPTGLFPGTRPAALSARFLARSAWWVDGSDAVLAELSTCLGRVPAALSAAPDTSDPAAGAPVPASSPSGRVPSPDGSFDAPPASGGPPVDGAGLGRSALEGYYRDLCLQPLASAAWNDFVSAYGQRPRAWVLQYLAAAEDQFDRHLADGLAPLAAWDAAFGRSSAVVDRLRAELRAVYGRSAVEDAGPVGPSGDAPSSPGGSR